MSVLTEPYVSPSRIRGVYRYLLLKARGKGVNRDLLGKLLMPASLQNPEEDASREMIRQTVNEGIQMRLFLQQEDKVLLNPGLFAEARNPRSGDRILPLTLAHCLFDKDNDQNHDLGLAIAWYLSFDAYLAPGTWNDITEETLVQARSLDLNDIRFGQLRDWTTYLGFAWCYGYSLDGRTATRILTPDPTAYLRRCLHVDMELNKGEIYPLSDILKTVAQHGPVLEGGFFRDQIERNVGMRQENHLSSTSSLGWLRLHEEGDLELQYQSDATETFIFMDGRRQERYSHMIWKD